MDPKAFFELSLATQVALGSGFFAYAIAYAGLRENHTAVDAVFITIAFAAISSLVFLATSGWGNWIAASAATIATVAIGATWRGCARGWWLSFLTLTNVHREDGVHRAWTSIVQDRRPVDQVAVVLKDGRTLWLLDRRKYSAAPWKGLYYGGDGSVVMVVEEEDLPDGSSRTRQEITHEWGTRMTYIPASEIARIEYRMKGR